MKLDRQDPRSQDFVHEAASHVLHRLDAVLGRAGVPWLPVKGAVTAHLLYSSVAERPIGDIDVRVPPERVEAVRRIAQQQGWALIRYAPSYYNVVFDISGLMVDVEGTIGPPGLCALSVREMLARSHRGGDGLLVPELHDHALVLVVNAFKDKLVTSAPWSLEDLRRIVRLPAFDVRTFAGRAAEAKAVTLAWFVADWLARERSDEAWLHVRDALRALPPRALYLRALAAAIARSPNGLPARILARIGSDDPRMWVEALGRAAAWELAGVARLR